MTTHRICKLFALLLTYVSVNAQDILITGKIIDTNTQQPIPYATVSQKDNTRGCYSNPSGLFEIKIANDADSLLVSHLSYKPRMVAIKKSRANDTIQLTPATFNMEEIVVTAAKADELFASRVEFKRIGSYSSCASFNHLVGIEFHPDSTTSKSYMLHRVRVFITKKGAYQAPFRIRVFEKSRDTITDVLHQSVITHAKKGNQWVDVDLSGYRLITNKQIIVAVEWLNDGNSSYTYNDKVSDQSCFGMSLGMSEKKPNTQQGVYRKKNNGRWWVQDDSLGSPMIQLSYRLID